MAFKKYIGDWRPPDGAVGLILSPDAARLSFSHPACKALGLRATEKRYVVLYADVEAGTAALEFADDWHTMGAITVSNGYVVYAKSFLKMFRLPKTQWPSFHPLELDEATGRYVFDLGKRLRGESDRETVNDEKGQDHA